MSEFELHRQKREVPYNQFVGIVKKMKCVWAGLSHTQQNPDHIYSSAILLWEYDIGKDCLFTITATGKRAECANTMPAFHIYDIEPTFK